MITGFTIEKLNIEKTSEKITETVKVHNNLELIDVEQQPLPFKDKKAAIKFKFKYIVKYEPNIGNIDIRGSIIYIGDESDQIIKEFKKEKKLKNEKTGIQILNTISNKCNVRALELSQDLNLPPPFNLPRFTFQTKASDYIG
jgi:hypothetical protein